MANDEGVMELAGMKLRVARPTSDMAAWQAVEFEASHVGLKLYLDP